MFAVRCDAGSYALFFIWVFFGVFLFFRVNSGRGDVGDDALWGFKIFAVSGDAGGYALFSLGYVSAFFLLFVSTLSVATPEAMPFGDLKNICRSWRRRRLCPFCTSETFMS